MNAGGRDISIAICTYNGEKFLREQLDSIAAQTVRPNELVVSDDGSSDETLSILKQFACNAAFPVRLLASTEKLGSTKNFEKAMAHCTAPIIALSDQDDIWKPNKLSKLASALDQNADAAFVFSDADLIDGQGNALPGTLWEWLEFDWALYRQEDAPVQFRRIVRGNFVTGATMALRASLLPLLRPFLQELPHDAWTATVAHACGWRGIALPERLTVYRLHASQQIGVRRSDAISESKRWILRETTSPKTLEKMCATHASAFQKLHKRLDALIAAGQAIDEYGGALAEQAARHQWRRAEIFGAPRIKRIFLIAREIFNGGYREFSGSYRRAIKDLLL